MPGRVDIGALLRLSQGNERKLEGDMRKAIQESGDANGPRIYVPPEARKTEKKLGMGRTAMADEPPLRRSLTSEIHSEECVALIQEIDLDVAEDEVELVVMRCRD